jgi:hypothetical protein
MTDHQPFEDGRVLGFDATGRSRTYEPRHFGASYMLNVLGLEPWVIAEQWRHSHGGALVVDLYGKRGTRRGNQAHPVRIWGNVRPIGDASGETLGKCRRKNAS